MPSKLASLRGMILLRCLPLLCAAFLKPLLPQPPASKRLLSWFAFCVALRRTLALCPCLTFPWPGTLGPLSCLKRMPVLGPSTCHGKLSTGRLLRKHVRASEPLAKVLKAVASASQYSMNCSRSHVTFFAWFPPLRWWKAMWACRPRSASCGMFCLNRRSSQRVFLASRTVA